MKIRTQVLAGQILRRLLRACAYALLPSCVLAAVEIPMRVQFDQHDSLVAQDAEAQHSKSQNLPPISERESLEQSPALDPSGTVYDAITREPVAGAVLGITGPAGFDPATELVGGLANVSQTTGTNGFYQYLLFAGAPAGTYTLTVTAPSGYLPGGSAVVPACTATLTVDNLPNPAQVHASNTAPVVTAPRHDPSTCPGNTAGLPASASSTQYYLSFNLTPGASGDVVNNHIPLDPITQTAFTARQTTPLVSVSRGDQVPYAVAITSNQAAAGRSVDVKDQIPPGFKYRTGSGEVDGVAQEPLVSGRLLTWPNLAFTDGQQRVIELMLVVGAGVEEGRHVNQAWAHDGPADAQVSNISTATVAVTPDTTVDCADLIGKVFDDKNVNGYQDQGEPGIPNVRVVTVRGLLITSDEHGRFHIACAALPNRARGSNFILKLDERTLPTGYRVTTENPRVVRLTRGKLGKIGFGAAIHRVVRLDLAAEAFAADSERLRSVWTTAGTDRLVTTLRASPAVLHLTYESRPGEPPDLAGSRLEHVRKLIQERWRKHECCNPIRIESEQTMRAASQ